MIFITALVNKWQPHRGPRQACRQLGACSELWINLYLESARPRRASSEVVGRGVLLDSPREVSRSSEGHLSVALQRGVVDGQTLASADALEDERQVAVPSRVHIHDHLVHILAGDHGVSIGAHELQACDGSVWLLLSRQGREELERDAGWHAERSTWVDLRRHSHIEIDLLAVGGPEVCADLLRFNDWVERVESLLVCNVNLLLRDDVKIRRDNCVVEETVNGAHDGIVSRVRLTESVLKPRNAVQVVVGQWCVQTAQSGYVISDDLGDFIIHFFSLADRVNERLDGLNSRDECVEVGAHSSHRVVERRLQTVNSVAD